MIGRDAGAITPLTLRHLKDYGLKDATRCSMLGRVLATVLLVALANIAQAEDAVETEVTNDLSCDPNYAGKCVPVASDVDCAGGNGNGPAFVQGPVRVIGRDVYELDRDGDGIACDKNK